jgi:hypothetical protein
MVLLVSVEAAIGSTCPLTSLESALRLRDNEAGYASDFIGYWLDRLTFYNARQSSQRRARRQIWRTLSSRSVSSRRPASISL